MNSSDFFMINKVYFKLINSKSLVSSHVKDFNVFGYRFSKLKFGLENLDIGEQCEAQRFKISAEINYQNRISNIMNRLRITNIICGVQETKVLVESYLDDFSGVDVKKNPHAEVGRFVEHVLLVNDLKQPVIDALRFDYAENKAYYKYMENNENPRTRLNDMPNFDALSEEDRLDSTLRVAEGLTIHRFDYEVWKGGDKLSQSKLVLFTKNFLGKGTVFLEISKPIYSLINQIDGFLKIDEIFRILKNRSDFESLSLSEFMGAVQSLLDSGAIAMGRDDE